MKTKKLINCPQCGGFGFTSTPVSSDYKITVCRGKICELCQGAGVIEAPMTNADRIRASSDEELAELVSSIPMCVGKDENKNCEEEGCKDCFLKWLQQPAEEG